MTKPKPNLIEQLNAAHHLNALSDSNPAAFNFVSKVIYEQSPGIVTPDDIQAAARFIDDVMMKRHRAGKVKSEEGRKASAANGAKGGRPRKVQP